MKKPNITPSTVFTDRLMEIKKDIDKAIIAWINYLGGKICMEYYHTECDCDRYTFFECDNNGYGREQFVTMIFTQKGKIWINLTDSEGEYNPERSLEEFTASETKYLLEDIENVACYIEKSGEEVVTEYPY